MNDLVIINTYILQSIVRSVAHEAWVTLCWGNGRLCSHGLLLSFAMRIKDPINWPIHPLMLSVNDLPGLPVRRPRYNVPRILILSQQNTFGNIAISLIRSHASPLINVGDRKKLVASFWVRFACKTAGDLNCLICRINFTLLAPNAVKNRSLHMKFHGLHLH